MRWASPASAIEIPKRFFGECDYFFFKFCKLMVIALETYFYLFLQFGCFIDGIKHALDTIFSPAGPGKANSRLAQAGFWQTRLTRCPYAECNFKK